MAGARKELKFQDHIIDSYKLAGGHARKWATDLQVGMPDLICALPILGVHLVEVKHRPDWKIGAPYANPLSIKQKLEAVKYSNAGGCVFGMVVVGSEDAVGSHLVIFDPTAAAISTTTHVAYALGRKYNINRLLREAMK